MKTAVVYYSMSGNVAYAAEKVAKETPADLVRISPKRAYPSTGVRKFLWGGTAVMMGDAPELMPYDLDFDAYDRIVFGTPVWASSFAPPLRTFVEENRDALATKRIAAFACSSGPEGDKALDKLAQLIGIDDFETRLTLIDPKDKPKLRDNTEIRNFCSRLG